MDAERSAPKRRVRDGARPRKKGVGAIGLFLLFGAVPIGCLGWFYLQTAERQAELLARIPSGAGGRGIKAAICIGLLFGLAKIALPAFHASGATLKGWLDACKRKPTVLRVLLFPAEFVIWLLWFVVQVLFALDAILIVAAAVGTLVLVARILKPDLLSNVLPPLLQ